MTQELIAPTRRESPADPLAAEIHRACAGLPGADPRRLPAAGPPEQVIREAAALVAAEPAYSRVAARLLSRLIADEAAAEGVRTSRSCPTSSSAAPRRTRSE